MMRIRIRREFGQEPTIYELPATLDGQDWASLSLSAAMAYVQRRYDPSLAYALSCGRGSCNICVVRIGDEVVTACTTPVTDDVLIEPARQKLQVKDVIVDMGLVKKARIAPIRDPAAFRLSTPSNASVEEFSSG
ncbi:2Fe-2S iron-sulfur cluster-binding protein [Sphingomonas sp. SRS2]|uniref:2Fe-2S iron-sulfur cluster-binding protein n=1 Tax=Sphingomonas sp. SRS2 TaxID=133190 RepID=UPI0006987FC5|nr:2Fe-2S iron-sulfur cluster-binding protein [Sphingomonas sp. SRS2]